MVGIDSIVRRGACLAWAVGAMALAGCGQAAKEQASTAQPPTNSPPTAQSPINPSPVPASAATTGAATAAVAWPTEEQAKAAIFKIEHDIHASQTNKDVWHVKDMRHEVHSVKFAAQTRLKQMNYGMGAITVYPAKILYTRITEYTGKEAVREEQGADGVWFLYQDSFGDWTGKYGSE
jgi:hypothetical protein